MSTDDVTLTRFRDLGRTLEDAWRQCSFDEHAFPALALKHLVEARLHESVSPESILDWAFTTKELPPQHDVEATFGQPPITMFMGRHFHISVLFWVDGTTSIHDHGFSGAFQVLAGSSIHTRSLFDERRYVSSRLRFGTLRTLGSALLSKGDAHEIASGSPFIHALFHLDRPSVSIVVRTFHDVESQPQLEYLPPHIAFDPFAVNAWRRRAEQLTRLLVTTNDPGCESRIVNVIRNEDLYTCFCVLRAARGLPDQRVMARWLAVLAERDADAASCFTAAFAEAKRMDGISKRRSLVVDTELRFFLAVLLNAPDRAAVLELFAKHRPSADPVDEVIGALSRIGEVGIPLQLRSEAWDPNIFGLPPAPVGWTDAMRIELSDDDGNRPKGDVDANVASYIDRLKHTPALAVLFRSRNA